MLIQNTPEIEQANSKGHNAFEGRVENNQYSNSDITNLNIHPQNSPELYLLISYICVSVFPLVLAAGLLEPAIGEGIIEQVQEGFDFHGNQDFPDILMGEICS